MTKTFWFNDGSEKTFSVKRQNRKSYDAMDIIISEVWTKDFLAMSVDQYRFPTSFIYQELVRGKCTYCAFMCAEASQKYFS
jgi:hypothetical protein